MSNTELGESSTTITFITGELSINGGFWRMKDELPGFFVLRLFLISVYKFLTETESKVLDKGLVFAPVQRTLNEPELRKDWRIFVIEWDVSGFFVITFLKCLAVS